MLGRSLVGAAVRRRARSLATATLAITAAGTAGGCLTRPIAPVDSRTTSLVVEKLAASAVDKIDLLLVVDNSASMADKQKILGLAIPDLIVGLVNPPCLDPTGATVAMQPGGPLEKCPVGSQREFPPVIDIHVGLISSSLGSFGTNGCPEAPTIALRETSGKIESRIDKLTDRAGRRADHRAFGRRRQRPRLAARRRGIGAAQRRRARRSVHRRARHRQAARARRQCDRAARAVRGLRRAGQCGARPGACRASSGRCCAPRTSRRATAAFSIGCRPTPRSSSASARSARRRAATTAPAILARVEQRAAQGNIAGALAELAKLPADARAPVQAWIAKAEARNKALDASRRLAADAVAALKAAP